MILRRLAVAIRRQDWFTVLIEIMIVVIGVVLALQVQQWAQDREERQTEAAYLSRLYDEVLKLEATRAPLIRFRENVFAGATSAFTVILGLEERALTKDECFGIGYATIFSSPTSDLAILNELQSTGRLYLIQDEKLKSAIRSYLLQAARTRDINEAIFRNTTPLVPIYPELVRISDNARPQSIDTDTFVCEAIKMRSHLEFRNRLMFTMGGYYQHLNAIRSVQSSLKDLRLALEHALGKSPTESDN